MGLYLHGYVPTSQYEREEMAFCCYLDSWEVQKRELPTAAHWFVGVTSKDAMGVEALREPTSFSWDLGIPGSRYWLVENDPEICQAPNGRIIWKSGD